MKSLSRLYSLKRLSIGLFMIVLVFGLTISPVFTFSQSNNDIDHALQGKDPNVAPVKFEGDILFYVRGASTYPAPLRAQTISKRILKAAANRSIQPDSVKVSPESDRIPIYAGNDLIMNVYPIDAEAEGIPLYLMADLIRGKITTVIKLYREERQPKAITQAAWKGALTLIITIISVILLLWFFNRFKSWVKKHIHRKSDMIEKISFKLIRPEQIIDALRVWYQWIRWILIALVIIGGINYMLSLFPWTRGAAGYFLQLFLDPLKSAGKGFLHYLPKLFFLIIIIVLTRFILNLTRLLFNGLQNGAITIQSFYPEWAMPAYQICRFLIIVLAVVMAFPYIPFSDTGAFQGISVFLGLLLSLGSSSFVSNIIAGYSLTFRRAFQIGDRIMVNDSIGTVENQSLMVTRLRSTKNEEIVIPNSVLINSSVLNYSKKAKNPGVILHTSVGIGYETPWRQVEGMLILAANRTEGLLKDPRPFVLQRALGDFAITYEINVYCTDTSKILFYYSKLHQNILDVFNEYDVQIMTPNYAFDPQSPKVVAKENWNIPPAENNENAAPSNE